MEIIATVLLLTTKLLLTEQDKAVSIDNGFANGNKNFMIAENNYAYV